MYFNLTAHKLLIHAPWFWTKVEREAGEEVGERLKKIGIFIRSVYFQFPLICLIILATLSRQRYQRKYQNISLKMLVSIHWKVWKDTFHPWLLSHLKHLSNISSALKQYFVLSQTWCVSVNLSDWGLLRIIWQCLCLFRLRHSGL